MLIAALAALVSVTASATEPIVLGAYLSMTGNGASCGEMGWIGISVARKMQPEVLGRPVDVKLADTKSDKFESAEAVLRLIEKDKVCAIIGGTDSSDTMAGADLAERSKIPMVSPTATNPIVTQGKKCIFRLCFIDTDQGRVLAKFAHNRLKAKTAALICDITQDYSLRLAASFKKEFVQAGGRIVSESKFKSGNRDFTPQLSSIKEANPDVICAPICYTECALVAKQAVALDLTAPILGGNELHAPGLLKLGGSAVEGIYFTTYFHKDMITSKPGKKFLRRFEAEYPDKELDSFTAMAADSYLIIVDAVKRAGSAEPAKIRQALAATKDFNGVTGKITMKPDGNPIKAMVIDKVKDGKFTYVTTISSE